MLPFPQLVQYGNTILPRSIVKIAASTTGFYVLFGTGNLYAIGVNEYYQFGTGTTLNQVVKNWLLIKTDVEDFYVGSESCLVKLTSGTWQYAGNQRLAGTTSSDPVYTTSWTTLSAMNYFANNSLTIKKIQIGATAIGVLCTNNTLYQMGYNSQGNFGTGSTANASSFIVSRTNTKDFCLGVIFSLATDLTSGILYRAGWNSVGQIAGPSLATGVTTWLSSGVVPLTFYAGRYTSSYVTSSNVIMSTGNDAYGAIANGHTTSSDAALNAYTSLNSGISGTIESTIHATKTWNTWFRTSSGIYATGRNDSGQLSIGSTTNVGTYHQVQLPSGVQASNVEAFEITGYCSFILLNDGRTIYCCGNSSYLPGYTTTQTTFVPLTLPE